MSIFGSGACRGTNIDEVNETPSDYAKTDYVDTQDDLRVLKAGDAMSGDLDMGGKLVRGLPTNHPPLYQGDEATSWSQTVGLVQDAVTILQNPTEPQNAATKSYVDTQDDLRVLKAGDTMSGDLLMSNNSIKFLQDPTEPQDAVTKNYVDSHSRKPVITVWAEEHGAINAGSYEWSFGNGATGFASHGYPMLAAGRVLRMGLSATKGTTTAGETTVNIVVNGAENTAYGVTKPNLQFSGTIAFGTPLELAQGDIINFRSVTSNTSVQAACVSLLIELDL